MTKTYKLTKIEQAIELATKLTKYWFRGHTLDVNELTPRIFRKKYDTYFYELGKNVEECFISEFKQKAPVLADNLPDENQNIEWLFLMQHHGAPTRLLDWTENALIALYFAVNQDTSCDGELWAMDPHTLNAYSHITDIPPLDHPIVRYLAAEPLYKEDEKNILSKKLGIHWDHNYKYPNPIAIKPQRTFRRLESQFSAFTIHPRPWTSNTISQTLENERELVRYIIPRKYKNKILNDLAAIGIKRVTLFQDLESLCESLKHECRNLPRKQEYPPSWGEDDEDC